jgi:hypothetical protein
VDKRRVDQSRVRLAEVEIGDETGTVSLRARDDQIDILEEISARSGAVVLRNTTIELYQGKHIRLAVTKWGKLSPYPDNVASTPPPPSKMNPERNLSLIDLSIVATEMVENPPLEVPTYPSSRPPKASETSDTAGVASGTSLSASKSSASKASQPPGKVQSQHTSRKSSGKSNDRRQPKGKGSPAAKPVPIQYGSVKVDPRQDAQPRQVVYHNMPPGYSTYEQPTMDMRQYHYSHHPARQSEVISAQQLMMQQQFEMQQRQLHQLYSQQQQHDRLRHQHHRQSHQQHIHQQPPHAMIGAMGSFDTASYQGEASDPQHPTHFPSGVASSPLMVPMGISSTGTLSTPSPSEHYSSPNLEGMPQEMLSQRSTGAMSPFPLGRMNPDATSFAPTYLSVTQGETPNFVCERIFSSPHCTYFFIAHSFSF